jgi:hypothetical protein
MAALFLPIAAWQPPVLEAFSEESDQQRWNEQ